MGIFSCTAHFRDLDGDGGRRSDEHVHALMDVFSLSTLWEEYGIVGDIIVGVITIIYKDIIN